MHYAQLYGLVLLPLVLLSLLFGWQGGLAEFLCYERSALQQGQIWRLITAHLVHGSFLHWIMNVLGLLLIFGIFECRDCALRLWGVLLFLSLIVSAGLFLFDPELQRYVGLSGVLHGLFAWHAMRSLCAGSRWVFVAIALLVLKILTEQIVGPSLETETLVGLPIIVNAHLYGAVGGVLLALGCRPWFR